MDYNSKFYEEVGKRIESKRKLLKLSRFNLSNLLSKEYGNRISEKTIQRIEGGENSPKLETILIICDYLNLSLDYVLYGKESTFDDSYTFRDNFKRLNRLLFSLMLYPCKNVDIKSPYYGKYIFIPANEEIDIYLNALESDLEIKEYYFNKNMFKYTLSPKLLDNKIDIIDSTNYFPSFERLIKMYNYLGMNLKNK